MARARCAEFQRRRDFIVPRLNAVPGLSCETPDGAFYAYVSCAGWLGKRTPEGAALADDAAVTAYLLYENGIVDERAVLSRESLPRIKMPNRDGFVNDPRPDIPKQ